MPVKKKQLLLQRILPFLPYLLCILFFIVYSILGIVRHEHYQSYGYDLGINDQVVWSYAHLQLPLTTIDPFPDKTKLAEHVELVYGLVAPFYWIWSNAEMLMLVRNSWICFSGIAVYKLAKAKGLNFWIRIAVVIAYFMFYGVQNAVWTDVHSAGFAAGFLMWFLYFLETQKKKLSSIFLLLAITAKENIGLLTFFTAGIVFLKQRKRYLLVFMAISFVYVGFIYIIYFPYIVQTTYLYQNKEGLLSNFNPFSLIDTPEKRQVVWYSLLSFGFLPLLSPLALLPALADLAMYFIVASELSGAQGLFGHYRITLAPFLVWACILAIQRFKVLNNKYIALYIVGFTLLVQFILHLPLSYLTKQWFWAEPASAVAINSMIHIYLPKDASVVAQNNIIPHISQRDKIYTLYPEKKTFSTHSPCGLKVCDWFRWFDSPQFLIVDISSDWDARHFLVDRPQFLAGIKDLEKAGVITIYKQIGTTILYTIHQNPQSYK